MATPESNEHRIERLESWRDSSTKEYSNLNGRLYALESWRTELNARHANTPSWMFGTISAVLVIISLVINLLVARGNIP